MLRICEDCTAAFAVGLKNCPQCGSDRARDQDADPYRGGTEPMPKITVHGGPSDAADIPQETDDERGGEQSSPGDSSSQSQKKVSSSSETSSTGDSKPARTTGNRTGRAGTGSSTARSTGTGRTARTSKTAADEDDGQ